jgi:hypothetical protein
MTIFIIPAVLALIIKLSVLYFSRFSSRGSNIFITMLIMLACHNVAEVLGYVEYFNGAQTENILRWYYVMTIGSLLMIGIYAQEVSGLHRSSKKDTKQNSSAQKMIAATWLLIAMAMGYIVMFSNLIVAGSEHIGYADRAIQGQGYWMFKAYSLAGFAAICGYLVIGYRKSQSHLTEIRCSYTLVALSPIVLTSLTLLVLMTMGVEINAAAVMPLATAAFLVITLKGEKAHGITDIRRHIPFSLERETSGKIMSIFSRYAQDEVNYRDALNEIETLLVLHKHKKHDGNVSSTAASMELPRSSLYSIFRRLDIEIKESK